MSTSTVSRSALVPYRPEEIFALVDDVESYPQFLPWCSDARVHERTDDHVDASIEISRSGFKQGFSTRNHNKAPRMIEMSLLEGPFRSLEGVWRFDPVGDDGCKISLDIDYEFSNSLVELAMGPAFGQILGTLVDAFCTRAAAVYGKR
ncbi:MAG: type II toxin-antitoxin system RatA family toxin [Gammaproteobacteria bacterium]